MLIVLVIGGVLIALATISFSSSNARAAARSAAQVFSRDLALARSMAVRGREEVVIHFYEASRWYSVTTASGRELARRRFGVDADINLSAIDLGMPGDSLIFSSRGVGDLEGLGAALGEASFTSGTARYRVLFNSMGASTVGES